MKSSWYVSVAGAAWLISFTPGVLVAQIGATKEEAAEKFKAEIFESLRQKATQVNDMFHMLVHA